MRPLVSAILGACLFGSSGVAWAQSSCVTYPGLCNLNVTSTTDQPDLAIAIDVVLVGDGFVNAADFLPVAAGAITSFQNAAANLYGRVPGLYNFHVVEVASASNDVADNDTADTALGMRVSGPYITADAGRMSLAALNAPDVDVVIAIANSGSGRANANYPTQLASGGAVRLSSNTGPITHELGHAIFNLADEYEEAALCTNPSESSLVKEPNVTTDPTCHKFAGAAGAGCIQGGKYCSSGVYRSANGCLMRSNGGAACPACSREIDEVLKERRSNLDWAPPWAVTTVPGGANPVAGPINLQAIGHDDYFTPMTMAFEIDGAYVGSAPAPTSFGRLGFDTTALADGSHTLSVFASDLAGHGRPALPVTFSTANGSNLIAPTIAINSPAQGAVLTGPTGISVSATGDTADIREIVLSIDGVPTSAAFGTASLFHYWDAPGAGAGPHVLEARAVDYSENVGLSAAITVTASITTLPPQTPLVEITLPRDGAAVGPYFSFEWQAEGGGPIGGTQGGGFLPAALVLDNVLVTPNPLAGQERTAILDARSWSLGPHQLRVRVTTANGTVDSDPVMVIRGIPSAPSAFILSPGNYESVRGVVQVEVAGADDVPLSGVQLRIDGVAGGSITGERGIIAWNSVGRTACVSLVALATSSDGGTGSSTPVVVCPDNSPPVVTIGWPPPGVTVPPGPIVVRADVEELGSGIETIELLVDGVSVQTVGQGGGSVALLGQLSAGNHTLQVRAVDRAGGTGSSAVISITAAACTAQSCDDGDGCTADRCAPSGACVHVLSPNCCSVNADCNDGDGCTTDTCGGGTCAHAAVAGCCNHPYDCDDGDLCTADVCSGPGGTCSHPGAGCCSVAGDCNDAHTCTTDSCIGAPGICANDWTPGCCAIASDCDDGDPCTAESCTAGACTSTPIANCCRFGSDCADGDNCTIDLCTNNVCGNQALPGCCTTNADCTTLNPCATVACGPRGQCEATPVASCCNFAFECDDTDPCTVHACTNNGCTLVSATAGCADAGFPPDADPVDADPVDADPVDAEPDDAAVGLDAEPGTDASALDADDTGAIWLDASGPDLGQADAGAPGLDAQPTDLGSSADAGMAAEDPDIGGGCGCSTTEVDRRAELWWLLGVGVALRRFRRPGRSAPANR